MQNSITRRDFGKLALVGAGSLLLADGLTLVPTQAHAVTAQLPDGVIRMYEDTHAIVCCASKKASALTWSPQLSVELYDTNSRRLVYAGDRSRRTVTIENAWSATYADGAYYKGSFTPVKVDCVRLTITPRQIDPSAQLYDGDHVCIYSENGWLNAEDWDIASSGAKSVGFPGVEQALRFTLLEHPNAPLLLGFDDLDVQDFVESWGDDRNYAGAYAESVTVPVSSTVYTAPSTLMVSDGRRYRGSAQTKDAWVAGVVFTASQSDTVTWRASAASTRISSLAVERAYVAALKKVASDPSLLAL